MLDKLSRLETPIRLVIVGMGAMGRGILHQSFITPGLECVGIADKNPDLCTQSALAVNRMPVKVNVFRDFEGLSLDKNCLAVCSDGELLARHPAADVFIESSSAISEGGRFSETALNHGKHLVLMNAEVDLTFGPYLLKLARSNGVVYTSCDGDQHGVIKRLIDEVRLWGFELVMAGNIKGYLDRYANPTSIIEEADKRGLDYVQASGYTDGTKLSIEMALVANALGMQTLKPGMYGPRLGEVNDVLNDFELDKLWRPGDQPFVDYVLGAQPGGGIFVIGYCDDAYQQTMLKYYKLGSGPYYLFYRPYHLCHVEAMRCIAEAYFEGTSLLEPTYGLKTDVYCYAKRNLYPGEVLDGPGGYTCYGKIENVAENKNGIPICLSEGTIVSKSVNKDQALTMADLNVDLTRPDFMMYQKSLDTKGPNSEHC